MGAPQQQRKILRIGIIQGGRITEERLIRHGETVTIGDGQKNTFVLHSAGLPRRFPLFVYKGTQYHLAYTDDMEGKLSMDGGVVMGFDGVKPKSTKQKDGSFHFPLTEQIRGKVTVGGTTILFQFVPPPPVPAKGASQRDFSSSWFKQVDPIYWGMLAFSAVLHATVMLYAMSLPVPKEMTLEDVPDTFAKFIVPQRTPPKPEAAPADEGKPAEEKKPEKKEEKKEVSKEEAPTDSKPQKSAEQKRAERKEELKKVGILGILGTRGNTGSQQVIGEIISGGNDAPTLDTLLKSSQGGIAVSTSGQVGGLRGGGDNVKGEIGDVEAVGEGKRVTTAKKTAFVPKADISGSVDTSGNIDRGTVDSVIKKNMGGVTACYDKALKLNPTLRGKIYIDFTVEGSGKVSQVNVRTTSAVDQDMVDCIKGRVQRWRFPASEEGPADVTIPIVLTAS